MAHPYRKNGMKKETVGTAGRYCKNCRKPVERGSLGYVCREMGRVWAVLCSDECRDKFFPKKKEE